jgi:hypothetical protein
MDSFEKIKVQWGILESQAHLGSGRQTKALETMRKNNYWMLDGIKCFSILYTMM